MDTGQLQDLYAKWLDRSIGADERIALMSELRIADNELVSRLISETFDNAQPVYEQDPVKTEMVLRNIIDEKKNLPVVHRVHFLRTGWFRYAAAVILILGSGAYLWFNNNTSTKRTASTETLAKVDVAPGSDKAILTLSNGQQVQLSETTSETISDGNLSIKNINGYLTYEGQPLHSPPRFTNTMTTPRGGQYKLKLADGTSVWLNAASSITYPTAFTGKTREVIITGEAYFEVARNKQKPFIVKTVTDQITVLGTSFNVNSYADEPSAKTTLIEGSISVNKMILQPSQAFINGKVVLADTDKDIAWKNGEFNFEDQNIEQAMRQISRWYDVEIVYNGTVPDIRFMGGVNRGASLSTVLRALQKAGVTFTIKGKKIIVQH